MLSPIGVFTEFLGNEVVEIAQKRFDAAMKPLVF